MSSTYFDDQWLQMPKLNLGSPEEIIIPLQNVEFVQSPETKLNYQIWESKH